jgi:D-tyrosyl-tRNA(Tyr) deacylase
LFAQTHKGSKPDFHLAMKSDQSKEMYHQFLSILASMYDGHTCTRNEWKGHAHIKDGQFGAMMQVALVNDGPVTIMLDSKIKK